MNVSKLADSLLLDEVNESITITWKGESPHSEKWRKTLLKKYFSEFGNYLKEISIKTGGRIFWILAFEKCALIGQTVSPGVGNVTHYTTSPVSLKSGRWTLNHDNSLTSSAGFTAYPIPKNVRSIKQLVTMIKEDSPTKEEVVTPADTRAALQEGESKYMEALKKMLPAALPPYSQVSYNEKKNIVVIKDAMGRHQMGALFQSITGGVFNVVFQKASAPRGDNINHVADPASVIISRVKDALSDKVVESKFIDALLASSFKDREELKVISAPDADGVKILLVDGDFSLASMNYRNGALLATPRNGEVNRKPIRLMEVDSGVVQNLFDEVTKESPVGSEVVKRWDNSDDLVDFKWIKGCIYEVKSKKKVVGKMVVSPESGLASFFNKNGDFVEELPLRSHSCMGVVELLRGDVNESRVTSLADALLELI